MRYKQWMILPCLFLLLCGARAETAAVSAPPGLAATVQSGTGAVITNAALTMDFGSGETDALDLSPLANVTADYDVRNPGGEDQTITLAIPFVASIARDENLTPTVSLDGAPLDTQVYYGGLSASVVPSTLGTGSPLSAVSLSCPPEVADGTLYTFTPVVDLPVFQELELQRRFYVRVRFFWDGPLIYGGFGGITTLEDGSTELTAWIYPERETWPTLTVFLPGGGTLDSCEINAYDDYTGNRTPLGVSMADSRAENTGFRSYLQTYLTGNGSAMEQGYWAALSDLQPDEHGIPAQPVLCAEELVKYAQNYNRIAMAVAEVPLAAGETRRISVASTLSGTAIRPEDESSQQPVYAYTWLPAPARAWADFGALSLSVIPPAGMICTPQFEGSPAADGSLSAQWDSLPEEISFQLTAVVPEPSAPTWRNPALFSAAAVLVLAGTGFWLLRRKK